MTDGTSSNGRTTKLWIDRWRLVNERERAERAERPPTAADALAVCVDIEAFIRETDCRRPNPALDAEKLAYWALLAKVRRRMGAVIENRTGIVDHPLHSCSRGGRSKSPQE